MAKWWGFHKVYSSVIFLKAFRLYTEHMAILDFFLVAFLGFHRQNLPYVIFEPFCDYSRYSILKHWRRKRNQKNIFSQTQKRAQLDRYQHIPKDNILWSEFFLIRGFLQFLKFCWFLKIGPLIWLWDFVLLPGSPCRRIKFHWL